jgi:hypothetical protein
MIECLVQDWQDVFKHFDRDQSGSIDSSELTQALQQFGYNLSRNLVELVQRKYGGLTLDTPSLLPQRKILTSVPFRGQILQLLQPLVDAALPLVSPSIASCERA